MTNRDNTDKSLPVARHHSDSVARANWSGVFAITLCAFVLVASEFMPVSLLTPMASALSVTEGMIGQGIAVSGVLAVLTSLSMPAFAGRRDRKSILLGLTVLMGISGIVIGTASSYVVYILGRALIGIAVGGFWSLSVATAMRLVKASQIPRAMAIFNSGSALATVVAAPVGAWLGSTIGWRGAFFCLVPIAVGAFLWQWFSLPVMKASSESHQSGNVFDVLKNKQVAWGMAGCGAFFMGQFALFTYIRPFLEAITEVHDSSLSLILLMMGLTGLLGTSLIGRFLTTGLYRILTTIPLMMAAIAVMLILFGDRTVLVVGLLAFWGLIATAAPVGWWTWLARIPHNAEAGGGLMVAIVQASIGLGSTVGGILYDTAGYQGAFLASAMVLLLGGIVAGVTSTFEGKR
ncbi:MFS transporter [Cronobacter dublinensis]|uniref:MFS transporter n=1 Tax=Cronobacter dublinensis TaxID=413497 RepID=UPI0024AFE41D|nr:MFS transporter [Cronobacter dublinensis]MDI7386253.1 MFS transporter [Cronobacter dublinensis]